MLTVAVYSLSERDDGPMGHHGDLTMTTTHTTRCETDTCTAPATTLEPRVEHDGHGGMHRTGEPVPVCDECAEQARHYPLGPDRTEEAAAERALAALKAHGYTCANTGGGVMQWIRPHGSGYVAVWSSDHTADLTGAAVWLSVYNAEDEAPVREQRLSLRDLAATTEAPMPGARVVFIREVCRYPDALIPAGAVGTVVHADARDIDRGDVFAAVVLDEREPGLDAWDNEVHWLGDTETWDDYASAVMVEVAS